MYDMKLTDKIYQKQNCYLQEASVRDSNTLGSVWRNKNGNKRRQISLWYVFNALEI
jgi:hypothetical protein